MTDVAGAAIYYRRPNGAVSEVRTTHPELVHIPDDAEVITPEQYASDLAALQAAHEQRVAEQLDADRARVLGDLSALRALGVPEATARRLAGWDADLFGEPEAGN